VLKQLFLPVIFFCAVAAQAGESFTKIYAETLYDGESLSSLSLQAVAQKIRPGSVVIVSELHNSKAHHDHQLEFLKMLRQENPALSLSVAMEFFYYTDQYLVDDFVEGTSSEKNFLRLISWGSTPFDFYRPLVEFPQLMKTKGKTYAINAPKFLTKKVAKTGLLSLDSRERLLLPPNFELGSALYRERFIEAMGGGHGLPQEKIDNYFAAQSLWDDTMAWRTIEALSSNPDQVVVVIVGDFHNAYGSGLPARLRARGLTDGITISQIAMSGRTQNEIFSEIRCHPKYGKRADFIWTSDE
jgi:uncharacterized iron-regulated protein